MFPTYIKKEINQNQRYIQVQLNTARFKIYDRDINFHVLYTLPSHTVAQ